MARKNLIYGKILSLANLATGTTKHALSKRAAEISPDPFFTGDIDDPGIEVVTLANFEKVSD